MLRSPGARPAWCEGCRGFPDFRWSVDRAKRLPRGRREWVEVLLFPENLVAGLFVMTLGAIWDLLIAK